MATATETTPKVEPAHDRSEDGELRFVIHNVAGRGMKVCSKSSATTGLG